jgi:CYTH domain-containing protein
MTLAVFETKKAIDAVEELARSRGGYLVSRSDQSVTVRVPTKLFQGTLEGVSKVGDELHREVNVRDVTEQYADLEIRLKNAEAVRQRLEALLAKAGKVEDALAVERELERLLSELVAFSTITANFQPRPRDQVGNEVRLPFPWLGELGLVPLLNLEAK